MAHNILWTILLGVVGGIISSLIVSRVFLIQSRYQEMMAFVDRIIHKIGYIAGFLDAGKVLLECSYDEDLRIEREMKEKGYRCEMEYYAANRDKNWISMDDVCNAIKKELSKASESIKTEILNNTINDDRLHSLLMDMMAYSHKASSITDLSFSSIRELESEGQAIKERYDNYKHMSGWMLFKLVIKDKVMIILFALVIALIAGTVLTGLLGV